jgi:hypothetical protein
MNQPSDTGYAAVDGVEIYWESYGTGGTPLVVVHGGFGLTTMFGELLDETRSGRSPYRHCSFFADADSMPISQAAEFFGLLGGGLHDAGWDGSARPEARLAILPGCTHYDILRSRQLAEVVNEFLA